MSSQYKGSLVQLVLIAVALGAPNPSLAGESLQGTWVLNLAKSKFDPGPPPKSQTRTMSVEGDMHTTVIETVTAAGEKVSSRSTLRLDGKDYPVQGNRDIDTVAFKPVDANTAHGILKRDGKVVAEVTRTLSADGRTLTLKSKGTNPQGKPTNNVSVFDRAR